MIAVTVIHVVGARPNFMKAGPVVHAAADLGIEQALVHTGQHYDDQMSAVFFDQLGLPRPDFFLGVGSLTHGAQTGRALEAIESVLLEQRPALVCVYGDVNSTLAGALAAAKLQIPVAHIESGLRSFDRSMPEEINRVVTDSLSSILFTTERSAAANLEAEGVGGAVRFVGNTMIDTLDSAILRVDMERMREEMRLPQRYALVTLHRPANVDSIPRLRRIIDELNTVSEELSVVFPAHPRTSRALTAASISPDFEVTAPASYLQFISLMQGALVVITDSGGVQEETTALGIPCVTVRPNTERPITVSAGTNQLTEPEHLAAAVRDRIATSSDGPIARPELWDGRAGGRIAAELQTHL